MTSIDEVAARAAVSKSTVSRAFSRPDTVRWDTRERVLAVARELGYEPNRIARSLAGGRTGAIGLFVPDIANPAFPPLIKAVQRQAARDGLVVFLGDAADDTEDELSTVLSIASQVDGMVLAVPRMTSQQIRQVIDAVPTVVVGLDVPGVTAVIPDNDGYKQALEHLAALGHSRIAFLRGPEADYSASSRTTLMRATATDLGVQLVELGPFRPTFESGIRAMDIVLASTATAVIAFNDLIALGLMVRMQQRGLEVGPDLSVIGIGDTWIAGIFPPGLTSVRLPWDAGGTVAARTLTSIMNGVPLPHGHTLSLPTELIVRSTTTAPRRTATTGRGKRTARPAVDADRDRRAQA